MTDGDARRERFASMYVQHSGGVLRYFTRRLRDDEAARDATSEVFTAAWRRLDDVPDDSLPWLYRTARFVLANAQRTAVRHDRLVTKAAADERGPSGEERPEQHDLVLYALDRLSDTDQEVLRLSVWDGLSLPEIAAVMGGTANAAGVRLHRARQRLRAALERSTAHDGGRTDD